MVLLFVLVLLVGRLLGFDVVELKFVGWSVYEDLMSEGNGLSGKYLLFGLLIW